MSASVFCTRCATWAPYGGSCACRPRSELEHVVMVAAVLAKDERREMPVRAMRKWMRRAAAYRRAERSS